MSESTRVDQLRIPKRLLAEWGNRPDRLGAWVDLALQDAETEERLSWTESELGRRWAPNWDADEVRAWLEDAETLGLVEPAGEGDRWSLRKRSRDAQGPPERMRNVETSPETPRTGGMVSDQSDLSFDLQELLSIEELERAYVLFVLDSCSNNKVRAASVLQIDPSTLHRKLRRWNKRS